MFFIDKSAGLPLISKFGLNPIIDRENIHVTKNFRSLAQITLS